MLHDDGTTSSGNWLYCGSWTEAGPMQQRRGTKDPSAALHPDGWSWPAPFCDIYKVFPYTLCLHFQISNDDIPSFEVRFEIQQDTGIRITTQTIGGPYIGRLFHISSRDWFFECNDPIESIMHNIEKHFKRYSLKPDLHSKYMSTTERCLKLLIANWNDIKNDTFGCHEIGF